MKAYRLTIPRVVACGRPRAALARHPKTRRILLNEKGEPFVRVYQDAKTRLFERDVRRLAVRAISERLEGFWAVKLRVFTADRRVIDLDNIVKSVVDGLVKTQRVPDDHRLWQFPLVERVLTDGAERIEVEVCEFEPRREGMMV